MSFFSFSFVIFVLTTIFLYYHPKLRAFQVRILVIASICFYAIDQFKFLPLLIAAAAGTYMFLLSAQRGSRKHVIFGVIFNLALLAFFKYKFLFINSENSTIERDWIETLLYLPIPVGISFFVFHNISLLADYGKLGGKRLDASFEKIMLYIIFFPQLVSGPITRAFQFFPQIKSKKWSDVSLVNALRWVILGACMKRFVADNIGEITVKMDAPFYHDLGSLDRLLLLFMYSFQIYADFFGYSAIAIGIALIFGYRLPINFNRPYSAASFSEFWRCWHISLSTWLRNYLYIPLGGNRFGPIRTYVNLMIVMLLGGLWHGAGINYLLWGGAHGLFLASERFARQQLGGRYRAILVKYEFMLKPLRVLTVFSCVSCVWVLFKLTKLSDVVEYMAGISGTNTLRTLPVSLYLTCLILATPVLLQHWGRGIKRMSLWKFADPFIYAAMLYLAVFQAGSETPFIYFQF